MGVSIDGFSKELRRHFGKYTPTQKSRMMFKFSIAFSIFSLSLTATGLFVDQLHSEDPSDIELKNGLTYHAPGIIVGNTGFHLIFPDCETPETAVRERSRLFSPKGVSFELLTGGPIEDDEVFNTFLNPGDDSVSQHYFGKFEAFYKMGKLSRYCGIFALFLQILAVIISIVTKTPPSSFLSSRPTFGHSSAEHFWGGLHHGLMMVSIVFLLVGLSIASTFLDLCIGRIIEMSFELCNFSPYTEELDIMKLYGNFLQHHSNVNGATGGLFRIAIVLSMVQMTLIFFQGIDQVRSDSGNTNTNVPASKLRQLPWYTSIWRMRFSLLFLIVAVTMDTLTSFYTRKHGFVLNVYAWRTVGSIRTGTGSTNTGALSDMIMDKTAKYYISESIPSSIAYGWIPLLLALCIGSTDPVKFLSKLTQLSAVLIALRSFFALSSISPIPSTVISRPYCYEQPDAQFSMSTLLDGSIQCNHLMFSIHAAFTTLAIAVVIMYIRYGPLLQRTGAYIVLVGMAIICAMLPIVARMNYSEDCLIAFFIAILLVYSQSAAWKILFRFEFTLITKKYTSGEILADKIIPTLNECISRMNMYQVASSNMPLLEVSKSEIEEIKKLYQTVGESIKIAKTAKPIEPMSSIGLPVDITKKSPKATDTPPGDAGDIINSIIASQRMAITLVEPTPIPIPTILEDNTQISLTSQQMLTPNNDTTKDENPGFYSQ